MTMHGIDISSYQTGIDLTRVPGDVVIIKATEGSGYRNPDMARQINSAQQAGKLWGLYHFVSAGNAVEAEVANYLAAIQPYDGFVPVLDFEPADRSRTVFARDWLARVEAALGVRPWIYMDQSTATGQDWTAIKASTVLWVAAYPSSSRVDGYTPPGTKSVPGWRTVGWQYTEHGYLPGWGGRLDLNVWYLDRAEWARHTVKRKGGATMASAQQIIDLATSQVGYREGRSPSGAWNNLQKYSQEVAGLGWSNGYAWCATFCSWLYTRLGVDAPVTASCLTGVAWWRARKRWSEYPAIGAQVFFGPGGGTHTGVVIAYDADTITTIEGNTNDSGSAEGNGVYRKVRRRRDPYVYGYGYPAWPEGVRSADPAWSSGAPPTSLKPTPPDLTPIYTPTLEVSMLPIILTDGDRIAVADPGRRIVTRYLKAPIADLIAGSMLESRHGNARQYDVTIAALGDLAGWTIKEG